MAKKKKKQNEITEISSNTNEIAEISLFDNKLNTAKLSSTNHLGYEGKLKMVIRHGNRILSTKEFHNTGTKRLFNFLCYCLQGDFTTAKLFRPVKIKLFNNKNMEPVGLPDVSDPASSGFIRENTTASIDLVNSKIVLHFFVPYAYISGDSINQICLYAEGVTADSEYSAYYYLTKTDGEVTSWDPIVVEHNSTFNFIVEWEMSVENK